MGLLSLVILLASAYATARYNVFGDVAWSEWPTLVLNKILALSALALLAIHTIRRRGVQETSARTIVGVAGFLAAVHVLLSLVLLSPAYYGKLFNLDRLTASAGIAMLLGALAAATLAVGGKLLVGPDTREPRRYFAFISFVIGLHAAFQGFFGWFTPWNWPGGMPPISLLSFALGIVALVAGLRRGEVAVSQYR